MYFLECLGLSYPLVSREHFVLCRGLEIVLRLKTVTNVKEESFIALRGRQRI